MELLLFLLIALVYGWIEAFAMEHGFSPGPTDFLGFKKAYHGAMLLLAALIGIACGEVAAIFWWVLVEDLAFWAASKWAFSYRFRLTEDSWITRMMGHLVWGRVMIPVLYIFLLIAGYFSYTYL